MCSLLAAASQAGAKVHLKCIFSLIGRTFAVCGEDFLRKLWYTFSGGAGLKHCDPSVLPERAHKRKSPERGQKRYASIYAVRQRSHRLALMVPCSAAERNGHKHGFCYRGGCPGIEEASICLFAEKKAAKPIFLTVLWPMQPVFILSMPAGYNTLTVFSFSQLRKHLRPAHNHCLPNRNSEWALPLLLNNVQT